MKRLALAALALATFTAPLLASAPASAHEGRGRHERGWDRHDRDYDDWDDRRDERRAYRDGYRDRRHDDRRRDRWDDRRYNGYTYDGRWYYGPPPVQYRDYARYEYRGWRRGDRLPGYYRNHYRRVDYRDCGLRAPPRGYHYVYNDDRDEYILVGIATGVILGVILAGG